MTASSPASQPPDEAPDRLTEDGPATGGTLTAAFLLAVGHQMGAGPLDADVLAHAIARLLPVDGVGISTLVDDLRLPLGASSAVAALSEEFQTTLGDGPCLSAARERAACVADLGQLLSRWPLYGEELTRRTPYRSVGAVPLRTSDGQIFAALDLYTEEEDLSSLVDVDEVDQQIGASLGALLDVCMQPVYRSDDTDVLPSWYVRATSRRQDVWVGVGMVMGRLHRSNDDALSLLRGYAYSHGQSLDDVAGDLIEGRLELGDLAG